MATYMVEVNNRFMVRLEIEGSACAAEHFFLDGFKGVWGALAFDQKSMKTDCFIGCMMQDELTTVEGLTERLTELDSMDGKLENISKEIDDLKETIKAYEERMAKLEATYTEELNKWGKLNKELNATRPQ